MRKDQTFSWKIFFAELRDEDVLLRKKKAEDATMSMSKSPT